MNRDLTFSKQLGVQLGIGIQFPGLRAYTENVSKIPPLRILTRPTKLELHKYKSQAAVNPLESFSEDEVNNSLSENLNSDDNIPAIDFENDLTYNHWKNLLLSKIHWNSLDPDIRANFHLSQDDHQNTSYLFDNIVDSPNFSHDYFPSELKQKVLIPPTSLKLVDPTVGDLLVINKAQNVSEGRLDTATYQLLVYASGQSNSWLNIAVIKPKDSNYVIQTPKLTPIKEIAIDEIFGIKKININATIKSIKIPTFSSLYNKSSEILTLLTSDSLHILKILDILPEYRVFNYKIYEPLRFNDFSDFPIADVSFNPWDIHQFAIVDIKGNWGIGVLPKNKREGSSIKILREFQGTIFETDELSNWKKIAWSTKYTRILVLSRSKIVEVDFEENWQNNLVEAKSWTSILDYKRFNDSNGVLLTSKELIIIGPKNGSSDLTRKISWKHDLKSTMGKLKISFTRIPIGSSELLLIFITSNTSNKIFCQGFLIEGENSIYCFTTPFITKLEELKGGISDIQVITNDYREINNDSDRNNVDLSNELLSISALIKNSKKGEFYSTTFTTIPTSQISRKKHVHFNPLASELESQSEDTNFKTMQAYFSILKENLHSLILSHTQFDNNENEEYETFQEYGYSLSQSINDRILDSEVNVPHKSIVQHILFEHLLKFPDNMNNLTEFTSLFEQISEFYTEKDIIFSGFDNIFDILIHENLYDLNMLFSKLVEIWEPMFAHSEYYIRGIIFSLLQSSMGFSIASQIDGLERHLRNELSQDYNELLDDWGRENWDDDISTNSFRSSIPYSSQPQFLFSSQTQIPTIKSSQSHSTRRRNKNLPSGSGKISKRQYAPSSQRDISQSSSFMSSQPSSTLPDTMTPAFSLLQSSIPTLSQSISANRSKKKKKKVGGFG
ncbi:hypothetical protein TBLA_0A08960 [Henningerozyma blattae CBS 6284]|uniref:RNA polymerase I-specific transcription initiation factor RRN6-like protein n=1 Tax=Henningerozyma blattae (strain ATCC 34711 / CBS 6284 / DSM 70876 / NBRC 10599 / NRRL Y-10934 / UCD 77-7) TaxID=1071380 RepID=I2GX33_HENB6|nr:hypothetical protein TBLA_0A08960 [Tetrapisispora blattae CBS 6284]CCH58685.1 hypothetical protein TBLA_0A08960 [Tetrapisispora blattae CBS 6284]